MLPFLTPIGIGAKEFRTGVNSTATAVTSLRLGRGDVVYISLGVEEADSMAAVPSGLFSTAVKSIFFTGQRIAD